MDQELVTVEATYPSASFESMDIMLKVKQRFIHSGKKLSSNVLSDIGVATSAHDHVMYY